MDQNKIGSLTINTLQKMVPGNSLAVQWLGLGTLTARARVQSLVWELSSHS